MVFFPQSGGIDTDGLSRIGKAEFDEQFYKLMQVNVLANIHLYNIFMPQILKSRVKKVVVLSSGHADLDVVAEYDIDVAPLYTASKAAMNMITGKFSAQYKKDGVLFLSICPGMVDVGRIAEGRINLPRN